MNTFSCVYAAENKITEKLPLSEDLTQKQNGRYNLRNEGTISKPELKRQKLKEHLLRKITLPINSVQNT